MLGEVEVEDGSDATGAGWEWLRDRMRRFGAEVKAGDTRSTPKALHPFPLASGSRKRTVGRQDISVRRGAECSGGATAFRFQTRQGGGPSWVSQSGGEAAGDADQNGSGRADGMHNGSRRGRLVFFLARRENRTLPPPRRDCGSERGREYLHLPSYYRWSWTVNWAGGTGQDGVHPVQIWGHGPLGG